MTRCVRRLVARARQPRFRDVHSADALFEVASAKGNVGLSAGITGPGMPRLAETMLLFDIRVGRLEISPVLVPFRSPL